MARTDYLIWIYSSPPDGIAWQIIKDRRLPASEVAHIKAVPRLTST